MCSSDLSWVFTRALSRPPDAAELRTLSTLHANVLRRFQQTPAEAERFVSVGESSVPRGLRAPELAAMATVTRAVLNLHEMITRN